MSTYSSANATTASAWTRSLGVLIGHQWALATVLRMSQCRISSAPGRIRTCDPLLRRDLKGRNDSSRKITLGQGCPANPKKRGRGQRTRSTARLQPDVPVWYLAADPLYCPRPGPGALSTTATARGSIRSSAASAFKRTKLTRVKGGSDSPPFALQQAWLAIPVSGCAVGSRAMQKRLGGYGSPHKLVSLAGV
jgi:hypothetical protein